MRARGKQRSAKRVRGRVSTASRRLSTAPRSTVSTVDTEGARRMAELPGSLRELAAEIGCNAQTIANWRKGLKVPDERSRALVATAWGIPPEAWGIAPHAPLPTNGRAPLPARNGHAVPQAGPASTLAGCLELLALLRADRQREGLLPADRLRAADTEARILALRHRLEKEHELLEDRIVREHPTWIRLRRIMVRALSPYPDAARAVAAALSEFDGPTSANADSRGVE